MRLGLLIGFAFTGVALLVVPTNARAQMVVGHVVEAGTLQPLAGAFVVLEDASGERQAAVLAGVDGHFRLRAPAPGRYRLVVRLIGYSDTEGDFLELGAGETIERRLEVAVRAIRLEGIRAEVGSRCLGRPDGTLRTAQLWEEARKALDIAAWAEAEGLLRYQLVQRRRELDAATLRVIGLEEAGKDGYYPGSPYRSLPAEELHDRGYVQPVVGGQWDHFAPDAEVLLSESFVDTHCFSARSGDDPELIGLGFEPVPGRTLPDIRGVLWLDSATAELRRLEYTYVNLPYEHGAWSQVGGSVEFERLATGVWIVRRWHIRMPRAAEWTGGFGGSKREFTLRSLTEVGAEVSRVLTTAGEVLEEAVGATLYGTVQDSVTGRPVAGARVEVVPTGLVATTAPDGAYRLGGLPAGVYSVEVSHPHLDLLAASAPAHDVRLESGRATRLLVRPSLSGLARELCGRAGSFQDPVVLHGAVRDPDGKTPVPGAVVRIWGAGPERQVTTDSAGAWVTCVERTQTVELAAAGPAGLLSGAAAPERFQVELDDGVLARADLTLPQEAMAILPSGAGASRGRQWSNAMIGSVVTAEDRAPIAGAMVLVRKTDGTPVYSAVTNETGQFRFIHPDLATTEYTLSVEHVAYGKVSRDVTFRPGEQLDLEVFLADHVVELDPIVVTERRRGRLVDSGFYDRKERGFGMYIERDEIERRMPSRLTDLLQGRSGLKVVDVGLFASDVRLIVQENCNPSIWLDGALVRNAGIAVPGDSSNPVRMVLSDVISPDHVEAIEVYTGPAGMPVQYGGSNAMCGVILIWSRTR